ncbi:MAG: N-acetylmuramoyl-L-alanine amidase [Verrucomicrobium sp.]|nr:N-acetylmuramoyl-L-alanine amidase [Verrucomicrobium sp.]
MMRRLLLLLLAVLAFSPAEARAADDSWHLVSLNRREYVTLHDFCRFYGFDFPGAMDGKVCVLKGPRGTLRLQLDSAAIYLNGVRYYLCFPVVESDGNWLLSRLDLSYLLEPALRPYRISGRRAFLGVVIDAGHGGTDNGATSTRGKMEKNYALDTAFRLEAILRKHNIQTVLTRRRDEFVPLEERARFGERYKDFIFVAIHFNSANPAARGLETYVETPRGAASTSSEGYLRMSDYQRVPGNEQDMWNTLLGYEIHRQIIRLNPGDTEADRGLKRARFVVLKENSLPSVLVEGGFLTNPLEAAAVDLPLYRQRLADAIATGIENFLQESSDQPVATPANAPRPVPVAAPAPAPAASEQSETEADFRPAEEDRNP